MTNSKHHHSQNKPSARQLEVLREMAAERGVTYAVPATAAEARAEFRRLRAIPRSPRAEGRREAGGDPSRDGEPAAPAPSARRRSPATARPRAGGERLPGRSAGAASRAWHGFAVLGVGDRPPTGGGPDPRGLTWDERDAG